MELRKSQLCVVNNRILVTKAQLVKAYFITFTAQEKVITTTIYLVSYLHMKLILSKCQLYCAVFFIKVIAQFLNLTA